MARLNYAPKKDIPLMVRFESSLFEQFKTAAAASDMQAQDAIRYAVQAMIKAHERFGKIPKDMEIRQAHIGDVVDLDDLLTRVRAVAEGSASYIVNAPKRPPERPSPKEGGTGPVAFVSDKPA